MYFSAAGNPHSWDLTNGYLDMPSEIIAIVPRGNTIFVFGRGGTHLIIGDTPPPGGNLTVRRWAFSQGCYSSRSTATYKDYVIFANESGVWKTDGSQPINLTQIMGVDTLYRSLYQSLGNGYLPLGVLRNYLFVGLGQGASGGTMVMDLDRNICLGLFTNVKAASFAPIWEYPGIGRRADLAFAQKSLVRAARLDACFNPGTGSSIQSGGPADADGTPVMPSLLTGFSNLGTNGYKRFRRGFLSYRFANPSSASLSINALTDPADFSEGLAIPGEGRNATTVYVPQPGDQAKQYTLRQSFGINRKAEWIQFLISMSGSADHLDLLALEAEAMGYDPLRAGDPHA
jgi:hypothetical protein